MRKKSLLLVIALMAVASVMAAMAYSSAVVPNSAEVTVVNSDSALLALIPGTGVGNADEAAYLDGNGILKIDLDKGNGGQFGLQGGSTYEWDNLFTVKNNSKDTIEFYLRDKNNGWTSYDKKLDCWIGANKDGNKINFYQENPSPTNNKVKLAPGETADIFVKIRVESGAKHVTRGTTLEVYADAVEGAAVSQ